MGLHSLWHESTHVLGALTLGFLYFVITGYLSLFGAIAPSSTLNQDWFLIAVGVFIGYGVARVSL